MEKNRQKKIYTFEYEQEGLVACILIMALMGKENLTMIAPQTNSPANEETESEPTALGEEL